MPMKELSDQQHFSSNPWIPFGTSLSILHSTPLPVQYSIRKQGRSLYLRKKKDLHLIQLQSSTVKRTDAAGPIAAGISVNVRARDRDRARESAGHRRNVDSAANDAMGHGEVSAEELDGSSWVLRFVAGEGAAFESQQEAGGIELDGASF